MNKTTFRSRTIEPERIIPIYHIDELVDLNECTAVSRSVTQMPTGMEREEESEHHIRVALEAQSLYGRTGNLVIPVPEITHTGRMTYPLNRRFVIQKTYIKQDLDYQGNDHKYDADTEDEEWLEENRYLLDKFLDKTGFETAIERLEFIYKLNPHDFNDPGSNPLPQLPADVSSLIVEYWTKKRQKLKHNHSLLPEVRTEQAEGVSSHDPYVAFRRRFEKMQTRKNRKYDENIFEKLVHTHLVLIKTQKLIKMTILREKLKASFQNTVYEMFKTRLFLDDRGNKLLNETLNQLCTSPDGGDCTTAEVLPLRVVGAPPNLVGLGVIERECVFAWKSLWRGQEDIITPSRDFGTISDHYYCPQPVLVDNEAGCEKRPSDPLVNELDRGGIHVPLLHRVFHGLYRYRETRYKTVVRDSSDFIQPVHYISDFSPVKRAISSVEPVSTSSSKRISLLTPASHLKEDADETEARDTPILDPIFGVSSPKYLEVEDKIPDSIVTKAIVPFIQNTSIVNGVVETDH